MSTQSQSRNWKLSMCWVLTTPVSLNCSPMPRLEAVRNVTQHSNNKYWICRILRHQKPTTKSRTSATLYWCQRKAKGEIWKLSMVDTNNNSLVKSVVDGGSCFNSKSYSKRNECAEVCLSPCCLPVSVLDLRKFDERRFQYCPKHTLVEKILEHHQCHSELIWIT